MYIMYYTKILSGGNMSLLPAEKVETIAQNPEILLQFCSYRSDNKNNIFVQIIKRK